MIRLGSDHVRWLEATAAEERSRTARAAQRARARRGGLASGRTRRALAKGRRVPHSRDRELGIAKVYPLRRATREQHRHLYEQRSQRLGIRFSERGCETSWQLYRSLLRWQSRLGQDFQTTNGQQSRGLANAGRGRCSRTVQRHRQVLAELGLVRCAHVRRKGALAGERDSLRVFVLSARRVLSPLVPKQEGDTAPPCLSPSCSPAKQPDSARCAGRSHPAALPPEPPPRSAQQLEAQQQGSEEGDADDDAVWLPGETFQELKARLWGPRWRSG